MKMKFHLLEELILDSENVVQFVGHQGRTLSLRDLQLQERTHLVL